MLSTHQSWKILIKLCHQIFKKSSNIKFHENLSDGSHSTQTYRWIDEKTDIAKLAVALRYFVNVPANETV